MNRHSFPTIAAEVVHRCEGAYAYTLECGYALHSSAPMRTCFPPARNVLERRNDKGRCSLYIGIYADGSRVRFTHNSASGRSNLKAFAPSEVIPEELRGITRNAA